MINRQSKSATRRDAGILHHLLGLSTSEQLFSSPARGNSFEGFLIEQLIAKEALFHSGSGFYYYRPQNGVEVDLIVDRRRERIGIENTCSRLFNSSTAAEQLRY